MFRARIQIFSDRVDVFRDTRQSLNVIKFLIQLWFSMSTEIASGDLDRFIPVTLPGPSTSMDDLEIKLETMDSTSRPPSSSRTSLSEDAPSPHYYTDEEEDEEMSEQEDAVDSDLEAN